jgi:hypothetical protein
LATTEDPPTIQEAVANARATLVRLAADLDTSPRNDEDTARWLIAEARSLTNHLLAALEKGPATPSETRNREQSIPGNQSKNNGLAVGTLRQECRDGTIFDVVQQPKRC